MTIISKMPVGTEGILATYCILIFLIVVAVIACVFYITKKQLNEKIATLQHEKNELLARLNQLTLKTKL